MAGGRQHCSRRKFQQYYRSSFVFHPKQNIKFSVVLPPCSSDIHYYRLAPDIRHHCVTALCLVHPSPSHLISDQRLDVAEVCLGNMGNAKGAAAVRRAKAEEPEKEAAVAQVSVREGVCEREMAWPVSLIQHTHE